MQVLPLFQIDAFTTHFLEGNPAAVVLLKDGWLEDETMQTIARKNNLSETAFVDLHHGQPETLGLRWFTPAVEMDLCGHATLAAAFVLFREGLLEGDDVTFETRSGSLHVKRVDEKIQLDFPSRPPQPTSSFPLLEEVLGVTPQEVHSSERDLLVVLESEEQVKQLRPNIERMKDIDAFAIIVSAPGKQVDFVSRFFAPRAGVPEDPVTGSAHCTLIPYWSKRLRQNRLHAHQLSERGGELFCEDAGERVFIAGEAVEYLRGTIQI